VPSPDRIPDGAETDEGIDAELAIDFAKFVWGAPRRHPRGSLAIFVVVALVSLALAFLTPRSYEAEVKLLVQRAALVPTLGNPRRSVPTDSELPLRSVPEYVLRYENLVALVKGTNLVDRWEATRPPATRLKDAVVQAVAGPPSEADRLRALVGVLEKRMRVTVEDDTIDLVVEWPSAQLAYQLVALAQQRLLDESFALDVSAITEAIAILEGHADAERQHVDAALAEMQRLRDALQPAPASSAGAGARVEMVPGAPSAGRKDAMALLADKRRAIRDLEEQKQRRVGDLRAQLVQLRTQYTDEHPAVLELQRRITGADEDPAELSELRSEERALLAQLANEPRPAAVATTVAAPRGASAAVGRSSPDEDASYDLARTKLHTAERKYEELRDRIDAARIELDAARAAFKYRFTTLVPAEVPQKAKKPNPLMIGLGGIVLAAVLAFFVAAAADLASGRILEPWQARRAAELPVLGRVDGRSRAGSPP
jgi:uncharacterized protein involved in exopolysaccharide biosynthesis